MPQLVTALRGRDTTLGLGDSATMVAESWTESPLNVDSVQGHPYRGRL